MSDDNVRYKVTERYAHGWTDWRAIYPTRITRRYKLRLWWRDKLLLKLRSAMYSLHRAYVRYRMRWTRTL